MKKFLKYTGFTVTLLVIAGLIWWFVADYQIYEDRPQKSLDEYVDLESDFQKLFQLAQDGETISLPAGHFKFSKALILDGKNNVTIKGAGMDKTVLSFRGQTEGAEGIRVANGHNITLEDFTIEDAIGDNLKAIYIDTLTFRNLKTGWTDVPNTELGAYGLYPVICKNVLIEGCEAMRASDSGIYIGQSENIVIRNNKTFENVCGINVENSANVDIYNNECYHNASGITALDIPGLTRYLDGVRIRNNKITNNTLYNFAPAGNIAASTTAGTGVTVWAGKNVSIYENEIIDNPFPIMMFSFIGTHHLGKDKEYVPVAASELARNAVGLEEEASLREDVINSKWATDKNYNPYNVDISIGDNKYSFGSLRKKMQSSSGSLLTIATMGKDAHLWYDGVDNPNGNTVCINSQKDFIIVDFDIMNNAENVVFDKPITRCDADQAKTLSSTN